MSDGIRVGSGGRPKTRPAPDAEGCGVENPTFSVNGLPRGSGSVPCGVSPTSVGGFWTEGGVRGSADRLEEKPSKESSLEGPVIVLTQSSLNIL